MMTPEKPTMAIVSGEKRDRNSDNTDKPISSPNLKDTKLLFANDKVTIGKEKGEETIEITQKPDPAKSTAGKDSA
jgi:hypothetical protein